MMEKAVNFFSGEFLLKNRPNGGTAVLLRSIWITAIFFAVLLPIRAYFAKDTIFLSHLARKSLFKVVIVEMLKDGEVVRSFVDSTHDGRARLQSLEKALGFKAVPPAHSEYRTSGCLTKAEARNSDLAVATGRCAHCGRQALG